MDEALARRDNGVNDGVVVAILATARALRHEQDPARQACLALSIQRWAQHAYDPDYSPEVPG